MKKIGITGSVASGKTTASKILAKKKEGRFLVPIKLLKNYTRKANLKTYYQKNSILKTS